MTTRADTVRIFVAVGISDDARQQLIDAVDRIRSQVPDGIQWASPAGMHLTLKFLGNIPASGVNPFQLSLSGLGMFPNHRKPRVLWAGVQGNLDALSSLQQSAENAINALGYSPEQRPFRPHITLGRPRRSVSDSQLGRIGRVVSGVASPEAVSWKVRSIDVMQSELHPSGARYTILGSVELSSGVL